MKGIGCRTFFSGANGGFIEMSFATQVRTAVRRTSGTHAKFYVATNHFGHLIKYEYLGSIKNIYGYRTTTAKQLAATPLVFSGKHLFTQG